MDNTKIKEAMRGMPKFENVDIISALKEIMQKNTQSYQSDFQYDKEIIEEAAKSEREEDKTLLWMSRTNGTYCFEEKNVFMQKTFANNAWHHYQEMDRDENIKTYAVEVKGIEDGVVKGDLFELDYDKHYERVKEKEVPADTQKLTYEYGEKLQPAQQVIHLRPDPKLGKLQDVATLPNDPKKLQEVLREEKKERGRMAVGDLEKHLESLGKGKEEENTQGVKVGDFVKIEIKDSLGSRIDSGVVTEFKEGERIAIKIGSAGRAYSLNRENSEVKISVGEKEKAKTSGHTKTETRGKGQDKGQGR